MEDGVKEALNVEIKKDTYKKKFKGDCQTCRKQGHKSVDCWKGKGKPERDERSSFSKGDHSTRKCYQCNKMGHIAANCPDKNLETGLVVVFCTEIEEEFSPTIAEKSKECRNFERGFEMYQQPDPEWVDVPCKKDNRG
jgi:hypothetical protein